MPDESRDARYGRRVVWLSRVGFWLIRVLGATWRVRVTGDAWLNQMRAEKKPVIFAFWHGHQLPLLYHHRNEGAAILISEHGDGEIVARIATSLGYTTVRGSTSRGAARALIGLERTIRQGIDVAVTPDGPRGPARSVAPGTAIVAQRSGAPILPTAAAASSGWRLNSWDRFLIPRPFSRVAIAYAEAVTIDREAAREAVDDAPAVRNGIIAAESAAEALAGGSRA